MDNNYYAKTLYRHAVCVGTTEEKNFIPLYNEIPKEHYEFVPMRWPTYGETFGKTSGAP
jgi:hypothetical protein